MEKKYMIDEQINTSYKRYKYENMAKNDEQNNQTNEANDKTSFEYLA